MYFYLTSVIFRSKGRNCTNLATVHTVGTMSSQLRVQSPTCHVRGLWRLAYNGTRHTIFRRLSSTKAVVISGVSCRLPSCDSFEEFGRNLRDGKNMVAEQTRFRSVRVPRLLGLINELDKFDAGFFKMPPRLAEASDPQLRMLLEVVLETIVDSGGTPYAYFSTTVIRP